MKQVCYVAKNEKDNEFENVKGIIRDFRYNLNKKEGEPQKVLFISDNDYAKETAKSLSDGMNMKLDLCAKETIDNIISMDLTSNLDALEKNQTQRI